MPNYPALAAQGVYTDPTNGVRVFAGQRAETFYIDLGAVFDTLNLRRYLPLLNGPGEDADNVNPFGVNRFSGFNVSTIAIEVPITRITSDGKPADDVGEYRSSACTPSTVAPENCAYCRDRATARSTRDRWVQVSRMGNPLVNELIIDTPFKDRWNASDPENEATVPAVLPESGDRHRTSISSTACRSCRSTARRRRTAPT